MKSEEKNWFIVAILIATLTIAPFGIAIVAPQLVNSLNVKAYYYGVMLFTMIAPLWAKK